MKRVVVLGRGGAGKTTAARRLGELLQAPVIELDRLFWSADLEPTSPQRWSAMQAGLAADDRWVMDGDLGPYDVLAPRLTRADTVIVLDFNVVRCLWRAIRRSRERFDFWWWVITWRRTSRPRLLQAVRTHARYAELHMLHSPRQLNRLMASLGAADATNRPDTAGSAPAADGPGGFAPDGGMLVGEVTAILSDLRRAGCRIWVAGGWGVDALVGHQTRPHRDLDLAVDARDEATAVEVLEGRGYRIETDWRPVRVELANPGGGWVDLHPVAFDDDTGHGRQAGLDGGHFDYPLDALSAGKLDNAMVACLSVQQQIAFHRGYEPRPVDLHDLELLASLDRAGASSDGAAPDRAASVLTQGLSSVLEASWGLEDVRLVPTSGPVGMGSLTVGVEVPGGNPFVAKWVPAEAGEALDRGSSVALELEEAGLSTGAPLPTQTEALSAELGTGRVALLRRVPGRPLDGTTADGQERMARVLARVHAVRRPELRSDPYLTDSLSDARDVEEWVVPSVTAVGDEYARLPALTWGLVHHDPAPEAFFHDPISGVTALIDWTGSGEGPVLFDVASALMYLGGPDAGRVFLDTYLGLVNEELRQEASAHLGAMQRFRGAVQAAYFSIRVAEGDLTGISGHADNLKGLHHARRMLVDGGVRKAAYQRPTSGVVLRPMRQDDLDRVGVVQEEGSVSVLSHVFPQQAYPFPRTTVRERWERELTDHATDCFVIVGADGEVDGFAATQGDELLHFGTAVATWGSGLARRAHDELVAHLQDQGFERARLRVFEANHHARHFYEHRGWAPDSARTTSAFPPHPVLLGYELDLTPAPTPVDASSDGQRHSGETGRAPHSARTERQGSS